MNHIKLIILLWICFLLGVGNHNVLYAQEPILNYNSSNKLMFNPASVFHKSDFNSPWFVGAGMNVNSDRRGNMYLTNYVNGMVDVYNETAFLGVIVTNDKYINNNVFSFEGVFSWSTELPNFIFSGGIKTGVTNQKIVPKTIFDRYDPDYKMDTTRMISSNQTYANVGIGLIFNMPNFFSDRCGLTWGLSTSHVNCPAEYPYSKNNRLPIHFSGLLRGEGYFRRNFFSGTIVYEFQDKRIFDDYLDKYLLQEMNNLTFMVENRYNWLVLGYGYRYLFERPSQHIGRIGVATYFNFAITYDLGYAAFSSANESNHQFYHQLTAIYTFVERRHLSGFL